MRLSSHAARPAAWFSIARAAGRILLAIAILPAWLPPLDNVGLHLPLGDLAWPPTPPHRCTGFRHHIVLQARRHDRGAIRLALLLFHAPRVLGGPLGRP